VDYQGLVKRLNLPTGWTAPTELAYDDIRARALTGTTWATTSEASTPASS
jgi:hypothetical protein